MATTLPPEAEASFQACKRPAWIPVVVDGDMSGPAASKFSGTPQLAEGEAWPKCRNCAKSMQMFVQLRLAELPEGVREEFGSGLLQMFFCTGWEPLCEYECHSWLPFADTTLVRIVPDLGTRGATATVPQDIHHFFAPSTIVGWNEVADYPDLQDWEEYKEKQEEWQRKWPGFEDWGTLCKDRTVDATKLGGWRYWFRKAEAVEYPTCPMCQLTMRLVFQIDSDDKVPYTFGNFGCGHITQCPTHKDVLTFGWTSFSQLDEYQHADYLPWT